MPPASASRATRVAQLLGLAPAAPPPGRIPAMLAARRRIIDQPMVPSVLEAEKLVPDALVARPGPVMDQYLSGSFDDDPLWNQALLHRAELGAENIVAGRWAGSFVDAPLKAAGYLGVASYPKDVPNASLARNVRRHEIMHGYNTAARQGLEGMPLSSRLVASAPSALSRPLDELAAQRAGGAAFMDIPWGAYAGQYAAAGELGAARVARALEAAQRARRGVGSVVDEAVEFAGDHPVLLGGGLTAAYMLGQSFAGEEE